MNPASGKPDGFALAGMLVTLAVLALLYLVAMRVYTDAPGPAAQAGVEPSPEQPPAGYPGMIEHAREKTAEVNKKLEEKERELRQWMENPGD